MAFAFWKNSIKITQNIYQSSMINCQTDSVRYIFFQSCLFRARKSTRERKLKLLKKRKAQKAAQELRRGPVVPYFKRKIKNFNEDVSKKTDDSNLEVCPDNVWLTNMFKFRNFSFAEAMNAIRESHHPTLYNEPNFPIHAYVELDMSTDKKTKFYDNFSNVVSVNYPFKHNENRSILVFCKLRNQLDAAIEAGATLAGGIDIITAIKRGKITLPDFEFIIAHPNIMTEMIVIRGLLKNKFPSIEKGTLNNDLVGMIKNFKTGIKYESKKDEFNPQYGYVNVQLGFLDMPIEHLEDNLRLILANIKINKPKRLKNLENYKFMKRCFLTTQLHKEKLLISLEDYMEPEEVTDSDDEDDEASAIR